jgi:multiple sugar transport system substrate-binding protein
MSADLSRRALLRLGGAAAGTLALASCGLRGFTPPSASSSSLDVVFWGEGNQNEKLIDALRLFQETDGAPGINPQYSGFDVYYDKLATRVAGGNPPDVFQIHLPYLLEYIDRGAVLPLDRYAADLGLDAVPGYVAPTVTSGGKRWFALLGAASQPAVVVDVTKLQGLGLATPSNNWDLDTYRSTMAEVHEASGGQLYGTADMGGDPIVIEAYMRSRGKPLFSDDGMLAFDRDDFAAWLQLWHDLRANGGAVPMNVTAARTGFQNDPVTIGKAAYTCTATSRGLPSMQSLTKDRLALATFPSGGPGSAPGTNIIPAGWFVISPTSTNIEGAVAMLKFLTTDPGATKAMGLARGVPIPEQLRATVAGGASGLDRAVLDNYELVTSKDPAPLQMYPPGASKLLQTSLRNVNQVVGFGQASVAEATATFFADAEVALA